jgi:hypothetical protein
MITKALFAVLVYALPHGPSGSELSIGNSTPQDITALTTENLKVSGDDNAKPVSFNDWELIGSKEVPAVLSPEPKKNWWEWLNIMNQPTESIKELEVSKETGESKGAMGTIDFDEFELVNAVIDNENAGHIDDTKDSNSSEVLGDQHSQNIEESEAIKEAAEGGK